MCACVCKMCESVYALIQQELVEALPGCCTTAPPRCKHHGPGVCSRECACACVCVRVLSTPGHDMCTVSHLHGSMTYQDVRRKCSGVFHTREKTLGSFKPLLFIYVPASPPAVASGACAADSASHVVYPGNGKASRAAAERGGGAGAAVACALWSLKWCVTHLRY